MPKDIDIPQEETNILPIRRSFFPPEFWDRWDGLTGREKDAYLLGWLSEIDLAIQRIKNKLQKMEDQEEPK